MVSEVGPTNSRTPKFLWRERLVRR